MSELKSFTLRSERITDVLTSEVGIEAAEFDNKELSHITWKAIWDTGATSTCISQKVVDEISLLSEGYQDIYTASGPALVQTFYINVYLPNSIIIEKLLVPCVDLGDNADVLIGMDIICQGDLAVTNFDGKTALSFRTPSREEIDFESHK